MRRKLVSIMTLVAFSAPGLSSAAEKSASPDRLDPCLKSINIIGASMGHVEKKGDDGKSMLHFLVRSNGAEYDVKCETDTGMVKDVSAHLRGAESN